MAGQASDVDGPEPERGVSEPERWASAPERRASETPPPSAARPSAAGPSAAGPSEPPGGLRLGPVRLVRGRLVATAAALLGLVLAVPLVFWPTHTVSVVSLGAPGSPSDFRQSFWSWGRYLDTTIEGDPQFDVANVVSLAVFVLALIFGTAATLAYAFRPGVDAVVVAAAGLTWAAAAVAVQLATRIGETAAGFYGTDNRIVVTIEPAGWCQIASAALLLLALGLVLARPVLAVSREPLRAAYAWVRSLWPARRVPASTGVDTAGSAPRVGIARLRDTPRRDPDTPERTGVGFTDIDPDDDRFGPPR